MLSTILRRPPQVEVNSPVHYERLDLSLLQHSESTIETSHLALEALRLLSQAHNNITTESACRQICGLTPPPEDQVDSGRMRFAVCCSAVIEMLIEVAVYVTTPEAVRWW